MSEKKLSGFVTRKELSAYLNISVETFRQKTEHLKPFLNNEGKRKRLYSPEECKFILKQLKAS